MNTERTSTNDRKDLKGTLAAIGSGALVFVGSSFVWAATQPGNHPVTGTLGVYFGVVLILVGAKIFEWSLKLLPKI